VPVGFGVVDVAVRAPRGHLSGEFDGVGNAAVSRALKKKALKPRLEGERTVSRDNTIS
jgi:hypothetical protein